MVFVTKTGFWFLLTVVLIGILFIGTVKDDAMFVFPAIDALVSNNIDSNYSAQVFFCPEDNCSSQLIANIDSAQDEIVIAIYSFTLDEVADALIRAKERGVLIRVIFDNQQAANQYSEDEKLLDSGIPVVIKSGSGYMHNKFIVIDRKKVLTGSFNYSSNADTKNDENLILIISEEIAKQYFDEFEEIWQEASE